MAMAGAASIAFSAILVRLADVPPSTAAFYRCLYALPPLALLAWWERRRFGALERRALWLALVAGVFFMGDLVFWHHAIAAVGAGLATVLGNIQVVIVPLAAWALLQRAARRADAGLGAGRALRRRAHLRRGRRRTRTARTPGWASSSACSRRSRTPASCWCCAPGAPISAARPARSTGRRSRATLVTLPVGAALGELDLEPTWPEHGWLLLLALSSQVVGWLLIAAALPRLPAALTSITLTLQPALSVIFAVILLDESPSSVQFAGVAVIIGWSRARDGGPPFPAVH